MRSVRQVVCTHRTRYCLDELGVELCIFETPIEQRAHPTNVPVYEDNEDFIFLVLSVFKIILIQTSFTPLYLTACRTKLADLNLDLLASRLTSLGHFRLFRIHFKFQWRLIIIIIIISVE